MNEGPIMIYKFKSQAAADVIMLQLNGDQMLTIVGKEPSPQGIITVAQIPVAIAALEAAIVTHEAAEFRRAKHPQMEVEVEGDSVDLRQRAGPQQFDERASALAQIDTVAFDFNFH